MGLDDVVGGKQPLNMNIDLSKAEDIVCPYCEETKGEDEPSQNIFVQVYMIKRVSALQSPTGEEAVIPLPIFVCQECGKQLTKKQ